MEIQFLHERKKDNAVSTVYSLKKQTIYIVALCLFIVVFHVNVQFQLKNVLLYISGETEF